MAFLEVGDTTNIAFVQRMQDLKQMEELQSILKSKESCSAYMDAVDPMKNEVRNNYVPKLLVVFR